MTEQSILAAVSGIEANQTYLDSIGENIANVNTIGYKSENVEFQDLLSQQLSGASAPVTGSAGVDPVAIGSGVRVDSDQLDLSEGSPESTGVSTDVAIQGNGYLVVDSGGQQLYTRDGALSPDANGDLATADGGLVMGWVANADGAIDTSAPMSAIQIPTTETIGATATTELTLGGNLPSWSGSGTPPTVSPTTYDAYDSLGNTVPVTLTYTADPGTANAWQVSATVSTPAGTFDLLSGSLVSSSGTPTTDTVQFGDDGQITGITNSAGALKANADGSYTLPLTMPGQTVGSDPSGYDFQTSSSSTPYTINLDVPAPDGTGSVTQFNSAASVQIQSGDGNTSGTLESYSIGDNGTITGTFSNGSTLALGQIALASFSNPQGLEDDGGGLYGASANSGQALVGAPGTGGRGTVLGGELEQSNVDLGTQLTDLIGAQEAYEANTKVLTTTDTVIQALENVQ